MPTYVYQVILEDDPDGEEGQIFEVFQNMSDPALTEHPTTGQPVRRLIQPPQISSNKWTDAGSKKMLSNDNLQAKGLTKYVKGGDGQYYKETGDGPSSISAPPPKSQPYDLA